jgi:integrase
VGGFETGSKTKAGRRRVPIAGVLREHLIQHSFVAGALRALCSARRPRCPSMREPPLHECRHTAASYLIAAGVNLKALSTYLGHANVTLTLNLYGHLLPGNEDEAAGLLDAYLERSNTAMRHAQIGGAA